MSSTAHRRPPATHAIQSLVKFPRYRPETGWYLVVDPAGRYSIREDDGAVLGDHGEIPALLIGLTSVLACATGAASCAWSLCLVRAVVPARRIRGPDRRVPAGHGGAGGRPLRADPRGGRAPGGSDRPARVATVRAGRAARAGRILARRHHRRATAGPPRSCGPRWAGP